MSCQSTRCRNCTNRIPACQLVNGLCPTCAAAVATPPAPKKK